MSSGATLAGQADKRRSRRQRILKGGLIVAAGHHTAMLCTVRNLTETGARLKLQDATALLPERFELIIEIDGFEAKCHAVWRKGGDLGVSFLETRRGAPRRRQVIERLKR